MIRLRPAFAAPSFFPLLLGVVLLQSCEPGSDSITGTETSRFAKPSCPGHPSCQDPPAPAGDGTVDVSGDVITAATQTVVIGKDSRNSFEVSGAGVDNSIEDELAFSIPAGMDGCVTDPADLALTDPSAVQRLVDRLSDATQPRTFRFKVDRKDPDNLTGALIHTWTDDGDGHHYRTRLIRSSLRPDDPTVVTIPSQDVYVYTGGSIVSWDTSTDEALACPNLGSVTVELHR